MLTMSHHGRTNTSEAQLLVNLVQGQVSQTHWSLTHHEYQFIGKPG